MSRLNQFARLKGAMTPRDHLRVKVPKGEVAPVRLQLSAMSYALRGKLGVGAEGELLTVDEEAQDALYQLADAFKGLVGHQVAIAIEERSRFTWEAFIGHCLRWWFGSGAQLPILKVLQMRLADHAIELDVAWAEGVKATRMTTDPSQVPLWIGGLTGLAMGQEFWWAPWPIALGLGLSLGWISMKPRWRCSAFGCGDLVDLPLSQCPHCGASFTLKPELKNEQAFHSSDQKQEQE